MNYTIRELRSDEVYLLDDFVFEAIYIPEGGIIPPRNIVNQAEMLKTLRNKGYKRASLAVQKMNYAHKLYRKVGFEIVDENEEEYIMIHKLDN